MSAQLLDGKSVAARIRASLAERVAAFRTALGIQPKLVAVLVGDDPASAVYVKNKASACDQAGFAGDVLRLPATTSSEELLAVVQNLNANSSVHGILVQLPLPRHLDATPILDAVHPLKDVDAFHPENVGRMIQGRPRFLPCTPHGVMVLLRETGESLAGRRAVVLGRSEIVGKPLAMLLMQKDANATVTVCHSQTTNLAEVTRSADVLIAAIGKPNFVTRDMVRPGAIVIDVGINRLENRLVGDVDFDAVKEVARAITPVPGGVGPMTIAMLLENTLLAARLQTTTPAR